jgi:hypothetical protein
LFDRLWGDHAGTYHGLEWGTNPYIRGTPKVRAERQWMVEHQNGKASEFNEDKDPNR